ncbi:hypothetical protein A3860_23040 [Niastella vici]|uniref:Uncharacterized protein n=1 Tax=Niastella vici TaxID=1703345 RepID=A0A1V9FZR0_9BACT|nr:hypothetical protein [Niastella vici]OQP63817.1 hypothetical protein A3860_23040 [Niastella vici]
MISSYYLHFINNHIEKLQTAIFYNFSQSILKFPACIIHVDRIDKEGHLLFSMQKPYRDISDFDNSFAGQLHFYNKRFDYYIILYGNATIIDGKDLWMKEALLRFRIINASYHYSKKAKTFTPMRDFFTSLFSYEKRYYFLPFN